MSQALAGSGLELLAPLRVLGQVVSLCVVSSRQALPARHSAACVPGLRGLHPSGLSALALSVLLSICPLADGKQAAALGERR